ncbi:MAG: rod shape-determining protein MreD [Sphingomonadaceae bacterium]
MANRIGRTPSGFRRRAVPIISTMLGSMLTLLPFIAVAPTMLPWGLIVFLAWRALQRHVWPVWMGVPLGLWDDLLSGSVVGTSMVLWTMILIGYEILDRQMIWRDFGQEWGFAAAILALVLLSASLISTIIIGPADPLLLMPQIAMSVLIFPLVTRLCAVLDEWRLR